MWGLFSFRILPFLWSYDIEFHFPVNGLQVMDLGVSWVEQCNSAVFDTFPFIESRWMSCFWMCCFMFAAIVFPYKGVWDSSEMVMHYFLYLCTLKHWRRPFESKHFAAHNSSNGCFSLRIWSWFQAGGGFLQAFETMVNLEGKESRKKLSCQLLAF